MDSRPDEPPADHVREAPWSDVPGTDDGAKGAQTWRLHHPRYNLYNMGAQAPQLPVRRTQLPRRDEQGRWLFQPGTDQVDVYVEGISEPVPVEQLAWAVHALSKHFQVLRNRATGQVKVHGHTLMTKADMYRELVEWATASPAPDEHRRALARAFDQGWRLCPGWEALEAPLTPSGKVKVEEGPPSLVPPHVQYWSRRLLILCSSTLTVLHLWTMGPMIRAERLLTVVHPMVLVWLGAASALGWVEASSLMHPVTQDAGWHTFSGPKQLEVLAACILAHAYAFGALPAAGPCALLPVACVALESAWLMPVLMGRAAALIAGKSAPRHSRLLQVVAVAVMLVKLISLVGVAVATR